LVVIRNFYSTNPNIHFLEMFAARDKLRNRCRYQPNKDWVPFLVDITDDKGKFVKRVPVLPPFTFDRKATAPGPTCPPLVCQHCVANHTFHATTAETDGAESETTVTDNEDEGDLDIITSFATYLSKYTSEVSFHRTEWVEDIQPLFGHPFNTEERPYPFLVKLPRPTKPKWGAKYGTEVVCMVVPPVPFDMICAGCAWRDGKANVVKVTTFSQNCCAKDNPCRFVWQGLPLPNAIDPVFTDLEMLSHGNPPVAAAAGAETAVTDDDKETGTGAAAAAAAGAVDKTTATVTGEAELQLGDLPRRTHPGPFAPPPYTGKGPTWQPPLDGNLPLSETMAREAMAIADEAIADEAIANDATADEATAAATLGTMRQVDPLVVGKKKRNRPIAAPAPPAPTRRSTRATKNNNP
jgi:hypothetical protein